MKPIIQELIFLKRLLKVDLKLQLKFDLTLKFNFEYLRIFNFSLQFLLLQFILFKYLNINFH
jgi:hypothetical protein